MYGKEMDNAVILQYCNNTSPTWERDGLSAKCHERNLCHIADCPTEREHLQTDWLHFSMVGIGVTSKHQKGRFEGKFSLRDSVMRISAEHNTM